MNEKNEGLNNKKASENLKENTKTEESEGVQKKSVKKPVGKDNKTKAKSEGQLFEFKGKIKELEDSLLRSLAENDNLRKRHEKETEENHKNATKNFAFSLLSVTDNFQRAIQAIPRENAEKNEVLKNLIIGIEAIEKELQDIFEKNGIKSYDSLKQKFDPERHQAVSKVNSELEEGMVVEELQRGFMIGDRLLRPSMVVVSMGPDKKKEENTKTSEEK